jgi:hypothetical protein
MCFLFTGCPQPSSSDTPSNSPSSTNQNNGESENTEIVGSTINTAVTWQNNKTYFINNTVTISSAGSLTIEPGVVVKFGNKGKLTVNGSITATDVTFTSWRDNIEGSEVIVAAGTTPAAPSDWYGITITGAGAAALFSGCTFKYSGLTNTPALKITSSGKAIVSDCSFQNNGGTDANTSSGTAALTWSNSAASYSETDNCVISSSFESNIWPLSIPADFSLASGNTFDASNTYNAILVTAPSSSLIAHDTVWGTQSIPYMMLSTNNTTLKTGSTLTIAQNNDIRFNKTSLTVNGILLAENVTFSSFNDEIGGWDGITVSGDGASATLTQCVFKKAGSPAVTVKNSAKAKIQNCTFTENSGTDANTSSGTAALTWTNSAADYDAQTNSFTECSFSKNLWPLSIPAHFSIDDTNDFDATNKYNAVMLTYPGSGGINHDTTWASVNIPFCYLATNDLSVANGATLTIAQNNTVKVNTKAINVKGNILANSVKFTSFNDNIGGWDGITVSGDGSTASFSRCTFEKTNAEAVKISSKGSAKITDCIFQNNTGKTDDATTGTAAVDYTYTAATYNAETNCVSGCTFTGNIIPLSIPANFTLDGTNTFGENTNNYIRLTYAGSSGISSPVSFAAQSIPYCYMATNNLLIKADFTIAGGTQENPVIFEVQAREITINTNGSMNLGNNLIIRAHTNNVWKGLCSSVNKTYYTTNSTLNITIGDRSDTSNTSYSSTQASSVIN